METQNHVPVLDAIDPELTTRLISRRDAIAKGAAVSGTVAAGLAMASVPVALAALARDAFAQGTLPADIKAVLDFALALEIFENEFYSAVLGTSSSAAQNTAFASVRASVTGAALATVQQIQKHEAAHVAFLKSQGATSALTATDFDFTGGRGSGNGPFKAATTDLAFLLTVAQGAEDTGVRAYKGQAGNLIGNNDATHNAVLEAALRIHSVEARHAARIRRIRRLAAGAPAQVRLSGTIRGGGATAAGATGSPGADVVAAFDKIYGGATPEGNTTHVVFNGSAEASINAASLGSLQGGADAVSEAFDEPLTRAEVVAIVQPFFIPTIA
ncbi:MAG TPA: ferritin-like domain-containing protein [Gemmatimonadaceae bacterium]|nr:ferritin-like domain-containing protein [Gemmatimonadaceae bacterium]